MVDITKKKRIKVAFVDFFNGHNCKKSSIYHILENHYDILIDEDSPEFVVYSCFGTKFLRYENAVRIFYTGENISPNFNHCDYAISFLRSKVGGRNLYFPIAYNHLMEQWSESQVKVTRDPLARKFCSFVYSNENKGEGASLRKNFCQKLMDSYKHVDCAGKVLHNYDGLKSRFSVDEHETKIEFLSQYKFNIAFENSNSDGYITEKLTDAFIAGTVPIYWGSEGNTAPFSKQAMICANDFKSVDDLIEYIKYVDNNDDVYKELLRNNPLTPEMVATTKKELENFLVEVVDSHRIYDKDAFGYDPLNKFKNLTYLPHKAFKVVNKLAKLYIKYFCAEK